MQGPLVWYDFLHQLVLQFFPVVIFLLGSVHTKGAFFSFPKGVIFNAFGIYFMSNFFFFVFSSGLAENIFQLLGKRTR